MITWKRFLLGFLVVVIIVAFVSQRQGSSREKKFKNGNHAASIHKYDERTKKKENFESFVTIKNNKVIRIFLNDAYLDGIKDGDIDSDNESLIELSNGISYIVKINN